MSVKPTHDLIHLAREASKMSYSPYSGFPVGCAISTSKGEIFTGCNVENISFGLSNCAERSAIFAAVSQGGPDLRIAEVVIYTPTELPVTPCGACRQVLAEFGDASLKIKSVCKNGTMINYTLGQLIPDPPSIIISGKNKT